jgi:hypothetical protein
MRVAALGAAALAVTALAVAAPAGAASPPPSATAAACDKTPWEPDVQGRNPAYHPGAPGGDYLWHNRRGFHLGVTHGNTHRDRVFSGVIHSTRPMWIDRVRLEKGDFVRLTGGRRTLVFVFSNHGWVDAVGFHTGCAQSVTVRDLHVGSHRISPDRVLLGKDGAHPAQVPFTLHRVPVPAG